MSRRAAAVPLAFALLVGGFTAVVPGSFTAPARADEVYPVPDGGAWVVPGHGWGHGHGLSQWGAQGAASIGRTATDIVSAYYPNTAAATLAASTIRVVLTESGVEGYRPVGGDDHRYECDAAGATLSLRCYLAVLPATGLTATDLARPGASMVLPPGADRWAVNVDATGLHLYQLRGASWSVVPLGGATTLVGPVRFSGPSLLRMRYLDGAARDYRGTLDAIQTGPGRLARVDTLSMEDYLLGVVPRESSSSWLPAALQAQAVAARSYSAYVRAHAAVGARWDICDSTWCQVFGGSAYYPPGSGTGYSMEPASTTAAVRATAGAVRTYAGAPIFAQFSASNGGWSTNGGTPYLTAHPDPWDGIAPNTVHSWTASLTAAQLQARYPAVGRLLRLRVLQRDGNGDWGGRVLAVALEGVDPAGRPTVVDRDRDGSPITGADIYAAHSWPASADGLRSSWWTLRPPPASPSRTPAAVAPAAGRIDLLERSDSGTLEQRSWTGSSGWSAPADLGGALLGGPAAASPSAGAVQALVRGTDGVLYGRLSSAGELSGWTSWGGRLTARPAAAATGDGRVDAFVRGSDGALYQRWSGPAGLAPGWVKLGGMLASGAGPAAATLGAGSPYVLVRGTDGALWSKYYRAGSWSGWAGMGGVLTDDPAAVATAPGRLAIFAKGVDGALWTRSLGAAGWSGWSSLGGALSSGPAAVVGSDGRLDVFAVGTDGHTYSRTRTTSWTGWVQVH